MGRTRRLFRDMEMRGVTRRVRGGTRLDFGELMLASYEVEKRREIWGDVHFGHLGLGFWGTVVMVK